MMRRILGHFLLTFALILRPDCYLSAKEPESLELNALLREHREIKAGNFASDSINKNGERLINLTFNFLNNPKNL